MGFKKYQKSEEIKDVTKIVKSASKNVREMTDEEKEELYGEMNEGEDKNA
jgi:hypothetical protein